MKKRNMTLFTAIAAAIALAPTAQAAPITAPTDGYTGPYRLMFITTAMTAATSTDINFYNGIADTAGDTVLAGDWKVLGGTATVSARSNTGALAVGDAGYSAAIDVPIYTTNGVLVADNNATLWVGPNMLSRLKTQTGVDGVFNQSIHVGFTAGGDIRASGASFGPLGNPNGTVAGAISSRTTPSNMYGNHSTAPSTPLSLIALSEVIGDAAPAADLEITAIDYAPDADPNPTVTLTWRSRPGTTYKAFSSLDLSDWSNELADSLGPETEGIIVDGDLLTMTFPLENGLENDPDVFFRIQEE